ncbi:MAG: ATP-dependent DNA helicase RecG [Actinomycetota bacterium]
MVGPPLSLADFDEMPVGRLKGIGPKREAGFAALGITTLYDVLTTYPRRYIDRTNEATIAELLPGVEGMVVVEIDNVTSRRTRNRKTMVVVDVKDRTGRLRLTFFNQPWRARQLHAGMNAIIFGRCEEFRGQRQMTNPVVDMIGDQTGRIVPVYPSSEKAGIGTAELTMAAAETLRRSAQRGLADPVPEPLRRRHDLIDRDTALRTIHAPETMAQVDHARRRLIYDELFRIQIALVRRKRELEESQFGVSHDPDGELIARFFANLAFDLTGAQRRTIDEMLGDLVDPAPMHRLLQGDVGAGKTVVAVTGLLAAVQGGHQGALMAPTEVLAEQHFSAVREMVEGLEVDDPGTLTGMRPLSVALLTNRTTTAERRKLDESLAEGRTDLLIGTHALIQDAVTFPSLGLVVIDEQHRFGVEQRAALRDKGADGAVPDVLVMTATPIPRTAAMTVYGDLDVSVLDEMPPGRTPIKTSWVRLPVEDENGQLDMTGVVPDAATTMWEHVRAQVAEGRQVYVVTPLVEESAKLEVSSAEETYVRLQDEELAGLSLGLLHGRVSPSEKEETMAQFRSGRLDVLVATTVIEVGVDVPNATVMVILDADRFGIAQLHQLRGRVGRGSHESYCYLVAAATNPVAEARLDALVASTDGFELAEIDLDLRGEGTIMGERQKGRSDLKLASLRRDRYWVEKAREDAFAVLDEDPSLADHPALLREVEVLLADDETEFLLKS